LPDGGCREDLRDKGCFLKQATKHGLSWYEYANVTRQRLAKNGSLYLVTGCDKTDSWAIASCSNSSTEDEVSLKFTAAQIASGSSSYAYKWETNSPATVRIGPPNRDWKTLQLQNVCEQPGDLYSVDGDGATNHSDSGDRELRLFGTIICAIFFIFATVSRSDVF
jgi:hypothetical protein